MTDNQFNAAEALKALNNSQLLAEFIRNLEEAVAEGQNSA
jgi:hypothetical protein